MEPSDFTRADLQAALADYIKTTQPEFPRAVRPPNVYNSVDDPYEAVAQMRADFFKFGVILTMYDYDFRDPEAVHSHIFSPQAIRVIAMGLLSAADSSEQAEKKWNEKETMEKSDQEDTHQAELVAFEQMAERTQEYIDMIGQDEPQDAADECERVEQREDPTS